MLPLILLVVADNLTIIGKTATGFSALLMLWLANRRVINNVGNPHTQNKQLYGNE